MEYFKHTITDVLKGYGCPICQIINQRQEKSFWWFFNDNYHDGQVLEDLIDNSSFCDDHADILENSDHTSLSFFLQVMILSDMKKLNNLLRTSDGREKGFLRTLWRHIRRSKKYQHKKIIADIFHGHTSCRFCRMNESTSRYVEGILSELAQHDPDFRDLYSKSPGLCRKHLIEVLKLCDDKASRDFFINDTIRRLNTMHNQFELYFHKLDYRFSHEPKGEEQNTWLDALNYYSGSKREGNKHFETQEV